MADRWKMPQDLLVLGSWNLSIDIKDQALSVYHVPEDFHKRVKKVMRYC